MLCRKETRKSSAKRRRNFVKNFQKFSLVKKREELSVVSFGRQFFEHPPKIDKIRLREEDDDDNDDNNDDESDDDVYDDEEE